MSRIDFAKAHWAWVVAGGAVVVTAVAAVLWTVLAPAAVAQRTATLEIAYGKVMVKAEGKADWVAAKDGVSLRSGDQVKTGEKSRAIITFFDDSVTRLDSNTRLTMKNIYVTADEAAATNISYKLWIGRTWNRIQKLTRPGSKFEAETPTAVATVRSTVFSVEVAEDGTITIATYEGVVLVEAAGRTVEVPAGRKTVIKPGGPPSEPVRLSEQDYDEWYEWNMGADKELAAAEAGKKKEKKPEEKQPDEESQAAPAGETPPEATPGAADEATSPPTSTPIASEPPGDPIIITPDTPPETVAIAMDTSNDKGESQVKFAFSNAAPGDDFGTQTVIVRNTGTADATSLAMQMDMEDRYVNPRYDPDPNLANVLSAEVWLDSNGSGVLETGEDRLVSSGSLASLYGDSLELGSVPSGRAATSFIKILFDPSAGNEYQGESMSCTFRYSMSG